MKTILKMMVFLVMIYGMAAGILTLFFSPVDYLFLAVIVALGSLVFAPVLLERGVFECKK